MQYIILIIVKDFRYVKQFYAQSTVASIDFLFQWKRRGPTFFTERFYVYVLTSFFLSVQTLFAFGLLANQKKRNFNNLLFSHIL